MTALGEDGGDDDIDEFNEADGVKEIGGKRALFVYWSFGMEAQFTRLANYMVAHAWLKGNRNYRADVTTSLLNPTRPYLISMISLILSSIPY